MAKACVQKKIRGGMSPKEAVKSCYPKATNKKRDEIYSTIRKSANLVKDVARYGAIPVGMYYAKEAIKKKRSEKKKAKSGG